MLSIPNKYIPIFYIFIFSKLTRFIPNIYILSYIKN